jgi:hypothetical protein
VLIHIERASITYLKTANCMKRRAFLKAVGSAAGAAALGVPKVFSERVEQGRIPRRVLGRTGARLSVVGFPGLALTMEKQVAVNHPHGNPGYPANAHAELPA